MLLIMLTLLVLPRIPIVTGVAIRPCRLFFRDLKNSKQLQTLSSAPSLIAQVTIKITSACRITMNTVIPQSAQESIGVGGNQSK